MLMVAAFSSNITAQISCNASFTVQSLSTNTFRFTPAVSGDSAMLQHTWKFGDGTANGLAVAPSHTYAGAGIYTVVHILRRINPNAVVVCSDSSTQVISVVVPCNIAAAFASQADPAQPLKIYFASNSTGFATGDSIRWSFGDGTFSYNSNPDHVYTSPGTYNVCLRVKKNNTSPAYPPCVSETCHSVAVSAPAVACNIISSFTSAVATPNNYTAIFTNTSAGYAATDSITWSFGDGYQAHTLNATHSYNAAGTYVVCLTIKKPLVPGSAPCVNTVCNSISIAPVETVCNLQVNYSAQPDSVHPNIIRFTNTTTGYNSTDSVTWHFGDGTISHDNNPVHTYANAGVYNVCLTVKKSLTTGSGSCIREKCQLVSIVLPCTLSANFVWYRDSGVVNLYNYHFTNTSVSLTPADSVRWTFGDGTSSNTSSPVHAYAQPGIYTVCLQMMKRSTAGTPSNCVSEICKTVIVQQACNSTANFSWHADSINHKKIVFTNTSNAATAGIVTSWSFGDGATATSFNAVHEYAQPGRYYVCLRIQYGTCINYKCDSITVTAPQPSCTQLSGYHFVRSPADNQQYIFTPDFIRADVQYTWTFGDGTGSHDATAAHHFAAAGNYTVCLTAFKNAGCASSTCNNIAVQPQPNCNNITLGFNDQRDPLFPNRIRFVAGSNAGITDQFWTITKLPAIAGSGTVSIHSANPVYVFADSGNYRVCLRATFAGGCIKELCKMVHIASNIPGTNTCTLAAYPNPATATVSINLSLAQPLLITGFIYNSANVLVGQKQQQGVIGANILSMNTTNLPTGIYRMRVQYGNQVCYASFVKI